MLQGELCDQPTTTPASASLWGKLPYVYIYVVTIDCLSLQLYGVDHGFERGEGHSWLDLRARRGVLVGFWLFDQPPLLLHLPLLDLVLG